MKIYTASYFEPINHHGRLLAVSRTVPKGFKVDDRLEFFAPSEDLLMDYKTRVEGAKKGLRELRSPALLTTAQNLLDGAWPMYVQRYREEIRERWDTVTRWLEWFDGQDRDCTLLCWEKAGEMCHRNLIYKLVERYRPEALGGMDCPWQPGQAVQAWNGQWFIPALWQFQRAEGRHVCRSEVSGKLMVPEPFWVRRG